MRILRTVYLSKQMDAQLNAKASSEKMSKAALIQKYIKEGLDKPSSQIQKESASS